MYRLPVCLGGKMLLCTALRNDRCCCLQTINLFAFDTLEANWLRRPTGQQWKSDATMAAMIASLESCQHVGVCVTLSITLALCVSHYLAQVCSSLAGAFTCLHSIGHAFPCRSLVSSRPVFVADMCKLLKAAKKQECWWASWLELIKLLCCVCAVHDMFVQLCMSETKHDLVYLSLSKHLNDHRVRLCVCPAYFRYFLELLS